MIFGLTNIITIAYLTIKIGFVIDGEVVELLSFARGFAG
jgi:hypothetical protein